MKLSEFRAQYPQYDDVPDNELAQSIHQQFYSDIPFNDFSKQLGIAEPASKPGLLSYAKDQITKAITPSSKYKSVVAGKDGTVTDARPDIERRGGPVTEEAFNQVKNKYEMATQPERDAMVKRNDWVGNVAKEVDGTYQKVQNEGLVDNRKEARMAKIMRKSNAKFETAKNIVENSQDKNEVSTISNGIPDRDIVDYALDTTRSIAKIAPTTGKFVTDVASLGTAYVPVVGDMIMSLGEEFQSYVDSQSEKQSPELRQKIYEMQQIVQNGTGDQLARFLAANPAVLSDVAIPSLGFMLVSGGIGAGVGKVATERAAANMATKYTGRSQEAITRLAERYGRNKATQAAIAANVGVNAGGAFNEADGDALTKYTAAAIAGLTTLAGGKLTAGGAEGAIARGGQSGAVSRLANAGKVGASESLQEYVEGAGQGLGVQTGETLFGNRDEINLGQINRQGLLEAAAAGVPGAAVGAMTANVAERQAAHINQIQESDAALDAIGTADTIEDAIKFATEAIKTPIEALPAADLLENTGIDNTLNETINGIDGDLNVSDQITDPITEVATPPMPDGIDINQGGDGTALPDTATNGLGSDAGSLGTSLPGDIQAGTDGQDGSAPLEPVEEPQNKEAITGVPIDDDWTTFTPESGSLGVSREEMPQIKAEHRGPMVNFLEARGIGHEDVELPASEIKPTQLEYSTKKVDEAKNYKGGNRSILISSDGHVLDGHHQWLASLDKGENVKAIRLNAPIKQLIDAVREFPSVETSQPQNTQPAKATKPKPSKRVNTLLTAIDGLGGIDNKYKWDVSGEQKFARGGYNKVFRNGASKTLEQHIENGDLDDFLPYELRSSLTDDPTAGRNFLADKIRNGERVIPYDEQLQVDQERRDNRIDNDFIDQIANAVEIGVSIDDDALNFGIGVESSLDSLEAFLGIENGQTDTATNGRQAEQPVAGNTQPGGAGSNAQTTSQPRETAPSDEVSGTNRGNGESQEREGVREIVTAIVRRRAAANEIGKLKAFDSYLADAKVFMNGKDVKPSKFKLASAVFKSDPPLSDAYLQLAALAKEPARESRQSTRNAVDIFTEQINNAKTVDELNSIARNIQLENGVLSDAMAQELDALVMERIDAMQDKQEEPDNTDLLGDDTAKQQEVADAERAKDAKRNSGNADANDFVLTGSNSEADQAAARGAQDLFSQAGDQVVDDNNLVESSASQEPAPSQESVTEIEKTEESKQDKEKTQPKTPLSLYDDAMEEYSKGIANVDDYKEAFEYVLNNEQAITDYLTENFTKQQLFNRGGGRLESRYKSEKKDRVIRALYGDMVSDFLLPGESGLTSFSYGFGGDRFASIKSQVDAITQETLDQAMQRRQAVVQENQSRTVERLKGIEDPQTLDDYQNFMRAKTSEGMTFQQARMALTPAQRIQYDEFVADYNRGQRKSSVNTQKTQVQATVTTTSGDIVETIHTKTGEPLFVVKAADRVDREIYNQWNITAKRLGGWYSAYRGNGAVPGFQFKTRENADAFLKYLGGDVDSAKEAIQEKRDAYADDRSQTAVERLKEMADRLESAADDDLGRDRKVNTSRRAGMAARAEAKASAEKAMAITMRNIATAIESGNAKYLDDVRQKVQVELLNNLVSNAQYKQLMDRYKTYAEYEKHKYDPADIETADFSDFPTFTLYRSDWARLGRAMVETAGLKALGNKILSVADDVTDSYIKFAKENLSKVSRFVGQNGLPATFKNKGIAEASIERSGYNGKAIVMQVKRGEYQIIESPALAKESGAWKGDDDKRITLSADLMNEVVEKIGKANRRNNRLEMPWQLESIYDRRGKLKRMGIETPAEMRAALREFIGLKDNVKAPDKIKELERSMIGRRNDGLDFFPTPAETVDTMIDVADIKEGMSILEPSAGMGHMADRIREAGYEPDVVELSGDRRELLEEKGYKVVANDFMQLNLADIPDGGYDRIIMNPPFSDRRDMTHVQHAYDLLKPDGKLVAIMGEGVFFGSDKRATEFRDWLDTVGGTSEKLDEGTFNDSSLPVNTSVNARMVVIDKSSPNTDPSFKASIPDLEAINAAEQTYTDPLLVDDIKKAIASDIYGHDVDIYPTIMDAPVYIQNQIFRERLLGAQGFFDSRTNKVALIAENIESLDQARQVARHELIGHYGIENMLNDTDPALLPELLKKVNISRKLGNNEAINDAAKYVLNEQKALRVLPTDASDVKARKEQRLAKEIIAVMAERNVQNSIMKRVYDAIRTFLKKLGFLKSADTTDADIAGLLRDAQRYLQGKTNQQESYSGDMAASFTASQVSTPAFKRWFGDSKVVDAEGKPLVVYHGTTADIEVFNPNKTRGVEGVFFTPEIEYANAFAKNMFGEGNISPVYLSLKNPAIIDTAKEEYSFDALNAKLSRSDVDGVIVKNEDGSIHAVIAIEPSQIKSAIGNNGNYDPEDDRISFSGRQQPLGLARANAFDLPKETYIDKTVRNLQDKYTDLKQLQKQVKENVGDIADRFNAYLQEELFHGRAAKRTQDFISKELDPLITDMRARGVGLADFEEYLWMRHAPERNAKMAEINEGNPDGLAGVSTEEAEAYLDGLTDKQRRSYEALAKRIDAINQGTASTLVSYGLESQATIDTWNAAYKHYVPLMREEMEAGHGNGTGQGFKIRGNSTKQATGSRRNVVDIIANIAQARERAIVRGEKNRVATALIGLAKTSPNDSFWKVDTPPTVKTVSKMTGFVEEYTDPNYKSRDNVIVARIPDKQGNIQERSVTFDRFNDRAMYIAKSFQNLDVDNMNMVMSTMAIGTRWIASVNTQYNPIFGLWNLWRDAQAVVINLGSTPLAGMQKEVMKNSAGAIKGIFIDIRNSRDGVKSESTWAQLWEEFQKEGGQTGYRDQFRNANDRTKAIEKALDPQWWAKSPLGKALTLNGFATVPIQYTLDARYGAKALFNMVSDYNETLENAMRLATYKTALDKGISKQQAASLAKNISVNFNRKGSVGQQVGAMYAFFNASVQGTARMVESIKKDGKFELTSMGKKVVYGGFLLGAVQALALAAAGFSDDEPPDFIKDRNIVIPIGDGKYLNWALPLGFNAIPAIGRISTELVLNGFREPGAKVAHIFEVLLDSFNPIGNAGMSWQTVSPTIGDPIVALLENRDWNGQPIYLENQSKLDEAPGHDRVKDTASLLGKGLSYAFNSMSGGDEDVAGEFSPTPDQIDYLIGQVTGGVGREISKSEQTISAMVTGEELPTNKIPLAGRLYGDTKGTSAQVSKFYKNIIKMNRFKRKVDGIVERGEDIDQYLEENPTARLVQFAKASDNRIRKLKKAKRKLKEANDTESIPGIEEMITQTMQEMNERILSAENAD